MTQIQINMDSELLHGFFSKEGRDEAFSRLLETILNQVLSHQASEQLHRDFRKVESSDFVTNHKEFSSRFFVLLRGYI